MYEPEAKDWKRFKTLAEFRAATKQETHGIEVDFDDFENLSPPDPAGRHAVYHAMDLNFRLNPKGKAVDAGTSIPTVNDGYLGRAPDLGALELGKPVPVCWTSLAEKSAILSIIVDGLLSVSEPEIVRRIVSRGGNPSC